MALSGNFNICLCKLILIAVILHAPFASEAFPVASDGRTELSLLRINDDSEGGNLRRVNDDFDNPELVSTSSDSLTSLHHRNGLRRLESDFSSRDADDVRLLSDFRKVDLLLEQQDNSELALKPSQSIVSKKKKLFGRHHALRHHKRQQHRMKEATDYLIQYGYLEEAKVTPALVVKAIKEFQELAGLTPTGRLNYQTLKQMHKPRCGNADISASSSLSNYKRNRLVNRRLRGKRFAQISHWEADKLNRNDDVLKLKYFVQQYTKDLPKDAINTIVQKAFNLWSDQVSIPSMRSLRLDFTPAKDSSNADINIMWAEGSHGDDYPFDGAGTGTNILAHTFYPGYQEGNPLNGDIHFDDHENWVLDNTSDVGGVHFPYVLVHEIGHALGLGHSKRQEAIMNPIYKQQALETVVLDIDDKCAVQWNYVGPSRTCLFVWLMVELLPRAIEANSTHGMITSVHASRGSAAEMTHSDASLERPDSSSDDVEQEVSNTLDRLQDGHIPMCTEDNNVQSDYEFLLEDKLQYSATSAEAFGPVICNFLEGMHRVVRERQRRAALEGTDIDDPLQSDVAISIEEGDLPQATLDSDSHRPVDSFLQHVSENSHEAPHSLDERENAKISFNSDARRNDHEVAEELFSTESDDAALTIDRLDALVSRTSSSELRTAANADADDGAEASPKKTIFDKSFFDEKFFRDLIKLLIKHNSQALRIE